ncbi:MAG: response regulator receiver protein [Enterovirga sp.]|jgi:two-component system chemotaxis response regulator CheY|nr:response regulator receiver protein [Enterovirga sp.]
MPDAPSPRILVVDDSNLVRRYYRAVLERAGFSVDEAWNGLEAIEKLLVAPYGLVIVDVNMPKMDGITFLADMRARPGPIGALPALVTSTEAGAQDKQAARLAGANYYLVKPVAEADLVAHVAILTGWRP